jgi:uncharacterized protein involved in exopolysaccharide biosynthesis
MEKEMPKPAIIKQPATPPASLSSPTSIALLLYGKKSLLAVGTLISTLIGLGYSFLAPQLYKSEATIAPKEMQGPGNSSLLSQMGSLGGLLVSQLGNVGLDRLEILLQSRELAERVIHENDLLPRLFPNRWDEAKKAWIEENEKPIPTLRSGVEVLRGKYLQVTINPKKKTLKLGAFAPDPTFAKELVDYYLKALNESIKEKTMKELEDNRRFLEEQLARTSDPLLRSKIQDLASMEIEKSMMMSSKSFDLLESPVPALHRAKPNRKIILVMACLAGAWISAMGVLGYYGLVAFLKNAREVG